MRSVSLLLSLVCLLAVRALNAEPANPVPRATLRYVLVWKLDRWGRSLLDCIHSIQELVSLGVRFLAVTQNFDTDENNPCRASCCTFLRPSGRWSAR